jgi:hypothetical protein
VRRPSWLTACATSVRTHASSGARRCTNELFAAAREGVQYRLVG